jgi:hypothetical protein
LTRQLIGLPFLIQLREQVADEQTDGQRQAEAQDEESGDDGEITQGVHKGHPGAHRGG